MRTRRLLASIGVPMLLALGAAPAATAAADPVVGQAGAADRQRLLFGIGPELDSARRSGLVRDGRVGMLTSWYSGPGDLAWMRHWRTTEVPRAYRAGYALHLVIHANDPEVDGETPYGRACGRVYPLTGGFLDHLRQLGRIFGGAASGPPLYVTMFTEFQTYPCRDNAWAPDRATTAYYRQLKDQYRAAVAVLHRAAPNVRGRSAGAGGRHAGTTRRTVADARCSAASPT